MNLNKETIKHITRYADCCAVTATNREVIRFAICQLNKEVWDTVDIESRKAVYKALIKRHKAYDSDIVKIALTGDIAKLFKE
ncbi:MAG: hypothetical protein GY861_05700 [bacterium]|nr:hypothetical protein [bacterium]